VSCIAGLFGRVAATTKMATAPTPTLKQFSGGAEPVLENI